MKFPNLKAEMARSSINCSDIAKCTNKEERTVRNWLSGKTEPTLLDVKNIRDTLFKGLTLDYLFADEALAPTV